MASNILTSDIDELYPVAGADNDSQGFRDNFRLVKTGLATAATEITALQTTTAKLNGSNDFNGNVIREANFIANSEEVYVTDEIVASQNIRFVNGNYQIITVGADGLLPPILFFNRTFYTNSICNILVQMSTTDPTKWN